MRDDHIIELIEWRGTFFLNFRFLFRIIVQLRASTFLHQILSRVRNVKIIPVVFIHFDKPSSMQFQCT